jgi:hypothetical protein
VMAAPGAAVDKQVAAAVAANVAHGHRLEPLSSRCGHRARYIGQPKGRQAASCAEAIVFAGPSKRRQPPFGAPLPLVSRFRNSFHRAASSLTNFGIEGH